MVLPGLQVTQSQTVTTPPQQLQSHPFWPSSHMQYWPQGQMQPFSPPFYGHLHSSPLASSLPFKSGPACNNPLYFKFMNGNIRICQGFRRSLQNEDGSVPIPPYDLAVARAERLTFHDPSGNLVTPVKESVCHYHSHPMYIHAVQPDYDLTSVHIPENVARKMHALHKEHIGRYFGIFSD